MNKVLYISNIEVPYRSEFFNQLSKKMELTVLYERKKSSNRDEKWASSVKSNYEIKYLKGINLKNEYTLDFEILKYVFSKKYDKIIIVCCNSPSQMLAIIFMKIFGKKYILNLDGDYFLEGKNFKKKIKRFFVKGAYEYLVAGEKARKKLAKYVPIEKIHSYYFSSLTKKELSQNAKHINRNVNNKVLVIGQYFDYKGLDIALEIAKSDQSIDYKFIGAGKRSVLLENKIREMKLHNVEVIPFLKKEDLYIEYQKSRCLLLPSRQECWGLVINEAASFGCPIIASTGSGAAVEFLEDEYENYLFDPIKTDTVVDKIRSIDNINYKNYLIKKSRKYNIEDNCSTIEDILKK